MYENSKYGEKDDYGFEEDYFRWLEEAEGYMSDIYEYLEEIEQKEDEEDIEDVLGYLEELETEYETSEKIKHAYDLVELGDCYDDLDYTEKEYGEGENFIGNIDEEHYVPISGSIGTPTNGMEDDLLAEPLADDPFGDNFEGQSGGNNAAG